MKRPFVLGAALVLAAGGAQAGSCTDADRIKATQQIERVVAWDQLHKAWQDFRQCDSEASISELYTDALLRLIVEWKNVRGLADPFTGDKDYREFVVKHLRDPFAKDDLESIYSRATMDCPRGMDAFCKEIAVAVRPAAAASAPVPAVSPPPAPAAAAQPK